MDTKTLRSQFANLVLWDQRYRQGTPLVSDAIYDDVEDQVRAAAAKLPEDDDLKIEIEEFLSGLGFAGTAPVGSTGWDKYRHTVEMGSLLKAQIESAIVQWFTKRFGALGISLQSGTEVVWSDKCDGISIALYYKDGKLTAAVTRGDGKEGENITRNVLKMKGIVPFIKGLTGFIRGEIVLLKSDHAKHFPTYANCRNAAAGISSRHDGKGCEHLTVLHYQIKRFDGKPIPNKAAEFKILAAVGAPVPTWGIVKTQEQVEKVYQLYIDAAREALDYDIDGLVLEFNDPAHMEGLGVKNLRPKGAIAYKFPHDKKVSILREILWQVGNTGRITPVAVFDAVKLAGATVTNASLANLSRIDTIVRAVGQEYLFAGDQIVVSRRNDVIPYVEEVIETDLGDDPVAFEAPTECPECGTTLTRNGEHLVCPNDEECPAQVSGAIKVWVKKLDLKGVGTTLIDALCEQGIITDVAGLYTLDRGELANVLMDGRRVGATAETVVDAIEAKLELSLAVFVGSLNIPLCSRSTCQTIVGAGYDTLDKMRAAQEHQISRIPKIGPGKAAMFVKGMVARKEVIDGILANGVTILPPASGQFKGMTLCMTGVRDSEMGDAFEAQGGTVKSSYSKSLTFLVAKDPNSTSGKAKKARQHGVEIVGHDDMRQRVGL
jgi:DNA ligase (NAD+)